MPAEVIIADFHNAVARDLVWYIAALALLSGASLAASIIIPRRAFFVFAISLTSLCGVLSAAALSYRASIPHRMAGELAAATADLAAAAQTFETKYGPAEAGSRFARLAAIWSGLFVSSLSAIRLSRSPVARGVSASIALLSAITFALDAFAYSRDLRYSETWRKELLIDL